MNNYFYAQTHVTEKKQNKKIVTFFPHFFLKVSTSHHIFLASKEELKALVVAFPFECHVNWWGRWGRRRGLLFGYLLSFILFIFHRFLLLLNLLSPHLAAIPSRLILRRSSRGSPFRILHKTTPSTTLLTLQRIAPLIATTQL